MCCGVVVFPLQKDASVPSVMGTRMRPKTRRSMIGSVSSCRRASPGLGIMKTIKALEACIHLSEDPQKGSVTKEQRQRDQVLTKTTRMMIEHTLRRMKILRILSDRFR